MYDEDLKDAHLIAHKLTHQVKSKSALTNDLYENAYNRNLVQQRMHTLNPTLSSKSTSVLMAKCKSLASLRASMPVSTRNNDDVGEEEGEPSLILTKRESSSKRRGGRSSSVTGSSVNFNANNDDDLVYILNNLKTRSIEDIGDCGSSSRRPTRSTSSLNG